jgi:hypothetical protein
MIGRHLGRALTETQRKRWFDLILECADEVGVPADPEFRSAVVAYLEWGTRLAVLNSQPGAKVIVDAPMPAWGWRKSRGPTSPDRAVVSSVQLVHELSQPRTSGRKRRRRALRLRR